MKRTAFLAASGCHFNHARLDYKGWQESCNETAMVVSEVLNDAMNEVAKAPLSSRASAVAGVKNHRQIRSLASHRRSLACVLEKNDLSVVGKPVRRILVFKNIQTAFIAPPNGIFSPRRNLLSVRNQKIKNADGEYLSAFYACKDSARM